MDTLAIITLLAVGIAIFLAVQVVGMRKRASAESKVTRGYFLLGLSGLMAKIAAADGRVTGDETEMANRFFSRMEMSDAERALCVGNFVTSQRDGLETRDHAKRFLALANAPACLFLYDMLWRISRVDGVVHPAEDKLLGEIATHLGLGDAVYENFKNGKKPHHDKGALRVAGVPQSLVSLAC